MDFAHLQRSWQQQAAPVTAPAAETSSLRTQTEQMHRFGRGRNWLTTGLLLLALACFLLAQVLRGRPRTNWEWLGLALLAATMLGFLVAMWWGTALRRAARPGLDSRAYLAASLRAFRFRRTALLWLGIPYALGFGSGLVLWNLPAFQATVPTGYWLVALAVLVGAALVGRQMGLRKYEREFGPIERELAHWQQTLLAES